MVTEINKRITPRIIIRESPKYLTIIAVNSDGRNIAIT